MDTNTAEHESSPVEIDVDDEANERREKKRRGSSGASTAARIFLALMGGGAVAGGYYLFKKNQAAQSEVTSSQAALRTARARATAADGRAADVSRQLDTERSHSHDLETQLAASQAHAQEVEGQLTSAQAERQQLGAQLSDATARAQEAATLTQRFHQLLSGSGGESHAEANGQISLQLVDRLLFASGEATLTPQGTAVLTQVADILRTLPDKQIWIEGHTDVAPVPHPDRFATNWELSTARALSVVHFLQDQAHIDPRRLAVVGFGQYRPLVHGQGARNRRIEIVLLPRNLRIEH